MTKNRCGTYSKLITKSTQKRSGVVIVIFEHISHRLVFLLLTLTRQLFAGIDTQTKSLILFLCLCFCQLRLQARNCLLGRHPNEGNLKEPYLGLKFFFTDKASYKE